MAIIGRNGSGKTLLAEMIAGRHPIRGKAPLYPFPPEEVAYLSFRDAYGGETDRTYYLQQRWNQTEIDAEMPTVGESLCREAVLTGHLPEDVEALLASDIFHDALTPRLDKPLVLLSSGELRKFHLAKTLLRRPRLLVIDNPFIGLDAESRTSVENLLASLAQNGSLHIVLVLSRPKDLPAFISHVVMMNDRVAGPKMTKEEYLSTLSVDRDIPSMPVITPSPSTDEVLAFNDVTIRYGSRTILSHFHWKVYKGQRWAISGRNGSGKSTLLSLVCADNPQAYACNISVFGHRRGAGQSIWEVKRRIGYVSPEMHRAYHRPIPVESVVASGFYDTVGLYHKATPEQEAACRHWMAVFGIENLIGRSFTTLSSGQQRLALLARAFVRHPALLILDEPFHGLDDENRRLVHQVINECCKSPDVTLLMVTHYADEFPACITDHLEFTS